VALVMTVVWPERDAATSNQQGKDIPDEPTAAFGERSRTVHRAPLKPKDERVAFAEFSSAYRGQLSQ